MAAGLVLGSCQDNKLDPLSGDFLPAPTVVKFTNLDKAENGKDADGRWIFNLDLSDDAGTKLHAVLVGNKYFLSSNTYSEAPEATAKNGNFIAGKTTVNGKGVRQGSITVKEARPDYTVSAVLFLEDGTPYKVEWQGQMNFEEPAVLEPEYTYEDTVAQDCTLEDGSTPVTDVESHTLVLKDLNGEFAAQIKLIRSVGTTDLSGTYTVKEYAHEDLTAGNGFDLGVYYGLDPGAFVIGSYYVQDGAVTIIEPGATISVSAMGDGVYSISGNGFDFLTAPAGFVPGGGEVLSITDEQGGAVDETFATVEGVTTHNLTLKDSQGTEKAWFQLVLTEGSSDFEGEYVCKEYAHEDHTFGNGYDLSSWGMGLGGTRYIFDGETVLVQPGETLTVTKVGEDTYKFVGSTGYEFTGKFEASNPGPGPGPDPGTGDEVTLTEFLSLTDYSGYGMNMVGIELGTKGFYYTAPDWVSTWTASYPVDGQFIKLELYSEGGVIAPGTYVPSAANGTVNAGEFNLGADNGWGGFNGTSWFTVASGAASGVAVTDGTVTVSEAGGTYTIVIETSAVKAKYVGTLGGEPGDSAVELSQFLSLTSYVDYGANLVGMNLASAGLAYTPADWAAGIYADSYAGSGNVLKLELYSTDGTVAPGTYKACATGGTVGEGEFGIGYDGMWGASGTTWYTVTDGTIDKGVYVTDGTVTVSENGGVYTIELKSSAVNAKYVGKLSAGGATTASISIDGNFDDWADVPSAEASDAFTAFKVFNDADNFYFYVETDPGSRLWSGGGYLYLYFNFKNDLTQGEYGGSTGMHDNKYDAFIFMYLFGGSADAPKIEDNPNGGEAKGLALDNIVIAGNQPATASDIVKMEIVIPRANFTTQVNAGDVIEVDAYRSKDGGNVYFPGYIVK